MWRWHLQWDIVPLTNDVIVLVVVREGVIIGTLCNGHHTVVYLKGMGHDDNNGEEDDSGASFLSLTDVESILLLLLAL